VIFILAHLTTAVAVSCQLWISSFTS